MRLMLLTVCSAALLMSACAQPPQTTQPIASPQSAAAALAATALPAPTAPATAAPSATAAQPTAAPPTARPSAVPSPSPQILLEPTPATASSGASDDPSDQPTPQPGTLQEDESPDEAAEPGGPPARIVIESIALDWPIVSVGLDKQRVPIVPDHDVGWYNLSARPGEGDNVVLWGHVLRFRSAPNTPAPFAKLKQLEPGSEVVLYDQGGTAFVYRVTKQVWVKPDEIQHILPQGKELVTMVSCIGDKVISEGEVIDMSHRLLTIAEPAET